MSDGFDKDEMMENQDFEEESLLSEKMAELMLEEAECKEADDEIEEIADQKEEENEVSEEVAEEKGKKQLQMTDFF